MVSVQVGGERGGVRVVEDQGGGQPQAGGGVQPVAQLHGGQRVEAELLERPGGSTAVPLSWPRTAATLAADQVEQQPPLVVRAEAGELPLEPSRRPGRPPTAAARRAGSRTRPRNSAGICCPWARSAAVSSRIGTSTGSAAATAASSRRQSLVGADRQDAGAGHPGHVGVAEVRGHPAALLPEPPGHRGGGQAARTPVRGQRVQEGVRGGVVALPGAAEHAGGRGEQHERAEIQVAGELVQVPGRVGLAPQTASSCARGSGRPAGRRRGRRRCAPPRSACGMPSSRAADGVPVGHVAGDDLDARAQRRSARRAGPPRRGGGPRRVASTRSGRRAAATRCRATSAPSTPVPPVTSTVPSARHTSPDRANRASRGTRTCPPAGTLRLTGSHRRQDLLHRRLRVGVHQHELARVLRLRGPHQTPHRGVGQVGAAVDGTMGDHHQLGGGLRRVGQPGWSRARVSRQPPLRAAVAGSVSSPAGESGASTTSGTPRPIPLQVTPSTRWRCRWGRRPSTR